MPVVVVIGGVALDVVACVVLLIVAYFAALMLVKPLAWLLGQIPGIGQAIAKALEDGVGAFEDWAQNWIKNALAPLVALVSAPVAWLNTTWQWSVKVAELTVGQLVSSIAHTAQLIYKLQSAVAGILDTLDTLAHRIAAVALSIPSIAQAIADDAVTALRAWVRTLIADVDRTIAQAIDTAHVELGHAIDGVNADLHQLDLALRHAIDTAVTGVQGWVNARLRPIEQEVSDIGKVVDALPAVSTIVATVTAVEAIETLIRECVNPVCSGLGPSLDILNDIADGAALAAMLALVAEAYADPVGTAGTVNGYAKGVEGIVQTILAPVGI